MLIPKPFSSSEADSYVEQFNRACTRASEVITEAATKFNNLSKKLSDDLGPLFRVIRGQMQFLADQLTKALNILRHAIEHQTPVISLIVQCFYWVDDVQKPMAGMATDVTTMRHTNFSEWTGTAATVYTTKRAEQHAAIIEMTNRAKFIREWLFKIVQRNIEYMAEVATMGGQILSYISKLAVKAGTIVGIPFAVSDAADLVGTAIEMGIQKLITVSQKFVATLDDVLNLKDKLAQPGPLANDVWPQAVSG